MSIPAGMSADDEIARVAYALWEAEGRPEGRQDDHWTRARRIVEEGRADIDHPPIPSSSEASQAPRPVQPGFEDAAPGMVPVMKDESGAELREEPGGRFAKQLADLPETEEAPDRSDDAGERSSEVTPVPTAMGSGEDARAPAAKPRSKPRRIKDPASV